MSIRNCLTISSTSYKNFFQYASVHSIELKNEKALSLATHLSTVPLILFLTVPAVPVLGLILCITKFIDERTWCCSCTDLSKNMSSAPLMKHTLTWWWWRGGAYLTKRFCPVHQQGELIGATQLPSIRTNRYSLC